jgi:FtsP/CotA-like multicopper oxidase with cupredoxin domain
MRGALIASIVVAGIAGAACTSGGGEASPSAEAGSEGAATLNVSLSEFQITPGMIDAAADVPVTITVRNDGTVPHSFALDAAGTTVQTAELSAGESATLDVPALEAGSYSAWCTVAGHRESGMTATYMVGMASAPSPGATGDASGGHSTMSAEQMAEAHKRSTLAFPAETEAHGNQLLEPEISEGIKVFHLIAQEVQWEVSPGQFVTAFGYNGQVPGPQIRVNPGDKVEIILENDLPQPTTLHFHGLTVPNAMDGVPYITQDPIMPGEYFVYDFTVTDPPGTYVYHAHFNSTEQVGSGLYGAFIVELKKPTWDEEYTLFLGDGPLGFVLNGKSFPATEPLTAKLGDTVLIRMANDGSMLHPMHLHGYHFQVVAQDGFDLAEPYMADTLVIAPGQRFDVVVKADQPGAWAFHCHILPHVEGPEGMFGMVTALIVE